MKTVLEATRKSHETLSDENLEVSRNFPHWLKFLVSQNRYTRVMFLASFFLDICPFGFHGLKKASDVYAKRVHFLTWTPFIIETSHWLGQSRD